MVIVEGIDLIHEINKFDVILVGTNTYCTMNYQNVEFEIVFVKKPD